MRPTTTREEDVTPDPASPARLHEGGFGGASDGRRETEPETVEDEVSTLRKRVGELEAEVAATADRHLRLAADFDNFRKRARQDQADSVRYASAELLQRLLPVL